MQRRHLIDHPYDDAGWIQVETGHAPKIDAELPGVRERELELCAQEQLDRGRMRRNQDASPIVPSQQGVPRLFDASPEIGHTLAIVCMTVPGVGETLMRLGGVPGDNFVVGQALPGAVIRFAPALVSLDMPDTGMRLPMFSPHALPLLGDDASRKLIGTDESRGNNRCKWNPPQAVGNGLGLRLPEGCERAVRTSLIASGFVPIGLRVAHKPNLCMTHNIHSARLRTRNRQDASYQRIHNTDLSPIS